jgi:nucleoside-diphosphate-sugar epimerase
MKSCVIFGGAGFVGTHLANHFLRTGRFDHIHIADIRPSSLAGTAGVSTSITDVRKDIPRGLIEQQPEWIFNLAAIHREPGHRREEYFETNLNGARNVCVYAEAIDCRNIYFTSSISVYGPTTGATDENSPIQPSTPYGSSKFPAELIHRTWKQAGADRRLIISRPGVLYGPGDPGNILRMINAIRRGYFAFPGSSQIKKSYGYIYGFIDSIDFTMDSGEDLICYNYVEYPTQHLGKLAEEIKNHLKSRAMVLPIPIWVLLPIAKTVQAVIGSRNPIHPVRVRKAATSTHIIPEALRKKGFNFRYNFVRSLQHWNMVAPEDFAAEAIIGQTPESPKLILRRGEESAKVPESPETVLENPKHYEHEKVGA